MKFLLTALFFLTFVFALNIHGENKSFNRIRTFDVQHYTIRLNFDRAKKVVHSDSTIELKPLSDNFNSIELDAAGLNFESIRLETSATELKFVAANGKVLINLDKPYDKNDLISLRFKYSVANPKKGIYFVDALKKRGKIVRAAQIWTQGEAEETHFWLPSFDFPDDKATTEQIITVEKGETVIGNGELIEKSDNSDGTKTFHYKMNIPHSLYLTSFVVGTYEKVTENYKNIPLSYYVYSDQKSLVSPAYGKTKEMMRIYEELTGVDFPYNKYDQTMVANFNFGGMENITATTMADSEIMLAEFPFARGLVEDLVSHELAHSWFGNLVTCRNWAELWLNESFATYMEAAYREKMYGRANYLNKIQGDADQYFVYASLNENNQHALFNRTANPAVDETLFTTVTYQKGSAVLHTLREEIGDQAFWKGVSNYLKDHKFQNVETADLQKAFEESSGKNLDCFFKQWVYGNKFPVLKIKQSYRPISKELVLEVAQTQTGDQYTPEVFQLPLDVEISMSKSKKTEKLLINNRTQIYKIPVDEKPFKVGFDISNKIPLKSLTLSKLTIISD